MRNGRMWAALRRRVGFSRPVRRGRDERGAVLVEAAIVIPILMMITLGIIEYGGAYRENSAVAGAARSGARVASSLPKTDFGCIGACPSGGSDSALTVAAAVSSALQSLGANAPQQMWIYKVGAGNAYPFTGCTNCVGYNWDSTAKAFGGAKLGNSWFATKQNACASGPPDQIGIYIRVKHTAITKMFGGDKTLTGTTIMRLEPYVGTQACAAS